MAMGSGLPGPDRLCAPLPVEPCTGTGAQRLEPSLQGAKPCLALVPAEGGLLSKAPGLTPKLGCSPRPHPELPRGPPGL